MKKIFPLILTLLLCMFSGCKNPNNSTNGSTKSNNNYSDTISEETENSETSEEVHSMQNDVDMFTDRDYRIEYDESNSILIQLDGDSASASSDSVKISGTTVTITEEATYILSGTLNDGMIIVDASDNAKLQLVLNGVNITSKTSAPLYILEADKVFVTLAADTENALSNGGTFTAIDDNNIDAAIFSKQDLTLNGSGSLSVTSPAGHGIVSKDDLVITSGTYTVNSASHGFDANDSIRIANADITIDAGKDGIHSENSDDEILGFIYVLNGTITIESEGDGISAGSYLQIEDGAFNIVSGGGSVNGTKKSSDSWGGFMGGGPKEQLSPQSSTDSDDSTSIKGLKAAGNILISNGNITIDSADDAVHSNTSITVNGGIFEIATGDDGFHADETLIVTDGTIHITDSYEGLEALNLEIIGGEIKLTASDDGLNAAGGTDASFTGGRDGDMFGGPGGGKDNNSSNGSIVISGGTLYIKASGDGIDANGTLTISDGSITVCGPTQGDTATLDYDVSGIITGGTFVGTGAFGMAQTFSDSGQGVISVNVGNQSAGTTITLKDKNGNTIISHTPELSYAVVILSSPDIISGETYTLSVGSSSGEFEAE